jgi:uncharacterized Fe-S center protein
MLRGDKMDKVEVLFAEIGETNKKTSLVEMVETLSRKAQLGSIIEDGDIVAVKVHMGERGSTRYLRPVYVGKIVALIRDLGGNPFVTDTPTLYKGGRANAIDALATARENGFTPEVLGAPIIISGGIYGTRGVVIYQMGKEQLK